MATISSTSQPLGDVEKKGRRCILLKIYIRISKTKKIYKYKRKWIPTIILVDNHVQLLVLLAVLQDIALL